MDVSPTKITILPIQKKRLKPSLCLPKRKEIRFKTSPMPPAPRKMIFAVDAPMYCEPVPVKRTIAIRKASAKKNEAIRFKIMRSVFECFYKVECLIKNQGGFQYGYQLQLLMRLLHGHP